MKLVLNLAVTFILLVSTGGQQIVSAAPVCDTEIIGFEIIDQGSGCTRLEIVFGCGRREEGFCYIEVCDSSSGYTAGCTDW
jgi:hypothetical protein